MTAAVRDRDDATEVTRLTRRDQISNTFQINSAYCQTMISGDLELESVKIVTPLTPIQN